MYSSYQMFECFGFINGAWIKGWDCGIRTNDGLTCFIAENDSRTKHYLTKEQLSYEDGA